VTSRYRLLQPLATGGMAELFLGVAKGAEGFERTVAIKRVLPHLAREPGISSMFMAEARLAMLLQHQNIVTVHDVGEGPEGLFLVMELVDGWDLGAMIRAVTRQGLRVPPHLAVFIASQAQAGLQHAYRRQHQGQPVMTAHRDVSPSNLLVSREGEVKVTDFGIARMAGLSRTEPGAFKGKVPYAAPEVLRGEPATALSDQFSLGTLLAEMLAGQHPFAASQAEPMAVAYSILNRAPASLPDVPASLATLVLRMLSRDPAGRFPEPEDVSEALARWLAQAGEPASSHALATFLRTVRLPPSVGDLARMAQDEAPPPASASIVMSAPPVFASGTPVNAARPPQDSAGVDHGGAASPMARGGAGYAPPMDSGEGAPIMSRDGARSSPPMASSAGTPSVARGDAGSSSPSASSAVASAMARGGAGYAPPMASSAVARGGAGAVAWQADGAASLAEEEDPWSPPPGGVSLSASGEVVHACVLCGAALESPDSPCEACTARAAVRTAPGVAVPLASSGGTAPGRTAPRTAPGMTAAAPAGVPELATQSISDVDEAARTDRPSIRQAGQGDLELEARAPRPQSTSWELEPPAPPPRRRRWGLALGLFGTAAVLAVGVLVLWPRYEAQIMRALGAPTPLVSIRSEPSGATVLVDGVNMGVTPLAMDNIYPSRAVPVQLKLKGYKPWTGTFMGGRKADVDVELRR
jgi:eukaryotic-like serine/threonine-protein kinase